MGDETSIDNPVGMDVSAVPIGQTDSHAWCIPEMMPGEQEPVLVVVWLLGDFVGAGVPPIERNKINWALELVSSPSTAHLGSGTWVETLLSNLYAGRFDLRKLMTTGLLNQTEKKERRKSWFGVVDSALGKTQQTPASASAVRISLQSWGKATAACMHPNSKALYNFAVGLRSQIWIQTLHSKCPVIL
jgi:hypothetical protein